MLFGALQVQNQNNTAIKLMLALEGINTKSLVSNSILTSTSLIQYHIGKLSLSQDMVSSSQGMDDLESALKSLEVKMVGDSNSTDMLVSKSSSL